MAVDEMTIEASRKAGFIAALDQGGGSTPSAPREYGVPDRACTGDNEMFRLIYAMRVR